MSEHLTLEQCMERLCELAPESFRERLDEPGTFDASVEPGVWTPAYRTALVMQTFASMRSLRGALETLCDQKQWGVRVDSVWPQGGDTPWSEAWVMEHTADESGASFYIRTWLLARAVVMALEAEVKT